MKYSFFVGNDKLPFLKEGLVKFTILDQDSIQAHIEVLVESGADLSLLLYAGVQAGISVAFGNLAKHKAA